jgi:carboxymethylenebutenolidase
MAFRGLQSETVAVPGHGGDRAEAYYAHPTGHGPFPGIVIIHHFPGWDEWTCEVARKFAHHGFAAVAPSLYFRLGDGNDPAIVTQARAEGGMPDDQAVGDITGAANFLRAQPHGNGKVGVIGFCSGGRHALLCACNIPTLNAAVDCWGGNVVVEDKSRLTARQPKAVLDMVADLHCPLLGLFGNEDTNPSRADVNRLEQELKRHGKSYEFHRYDGAGHAFNAWYRPNYRQEQAQDGWARTLDFFARHLGE